MHKAESEHSLLTDVMQNVEQVMIGKSYAVTLCLVSLLAGGHVLLEDVPGVGKTTLVKAISKSIGAQFKRIQFTPDLLPSDVTGVSIFNQKTREFEYRPGPIMGQIVLADEINRTTPKTQAALLEAMEEGTVTVDGVTYQLPQPFFVLATQNPIEYEGTFPLPEAQLDRFLVKLELGYPEFADELKILSSSISQQIDHLAQVTNPDQIQKLRESVKKVYVDPNVQEYIVHIIRATRNHNHVYLGASPRGTLALYKSAQAFAFLKGRDYVIPDDIKFLAVPTLSHRIIMNGESRMKGFKPEAIVESVIKSVPVPIGLSKGALQR
jgi:MoxR-like ATPase